MRAELDNLRAAVTWALDATTAPIVELALRIIAALAMQESFDPSLGSARGRERARSSCDAAASRPTSRACSPRPRVRPLIAGRLRRGDASVAQSAHRRRAPGRLAMAVGLAIDTSSASSICIEATGYAAAERLEALAGVWQCITRRSPIEQVTTSTMAGGIRAAAR